MRITRGTKEVLSVDIVDRTGNTTDLSTATPKFDVQEDDDTYVYQDATATATGMRIFCLVDTSTTGPSGQLPVGHYRLFVKFTVGSEIVRKGPLDFYLIEENG